MVGAALSDVGRADGKSPFQLHFQAATRAEAGDRQVRNARLACVNGTGGWFSSAATAILGVE